MIYDFISDESGATSIEYALIASIVSVGIIASIMSFTDALNTTYNSVETAVVSATP